MVFVERAEDDPNWQSIKRRWGYLWGQSNGRGTAATPRNFTGFNRTRTKRRYPARKYRKTFKRYKRTFGGRRKLFRRRRLYRRQRSGRRRTRSSSFQKKVQAIINRQIPWVASKRTGYFGGKWGSKQAWWWNIGVGQTADANGCKWITSMTNEATMKYDIPELSSVMTLVKNTVVPSVPISDLITKPYRVQIEKDDLLVTLSNPCSFPITVYAYYLKYKIDNSESWPNYNCTACVLDDLKRSGIIEGATSTGWSIQQQADVCPLSGENSETKWKCYKTKKCEIAAGGKVSFYLPTTTKGIHKTTNLLMKQYRSEYYRELLFKFVGPVTHRVSNNSEVFTGGGAVQITAISFQKARHLEGKSDNEYATEAYYTSKVPIYSSNYGGANILVGPSADTTEVQCQNMNKPATQADTL